MLPFFTALGTLFQYVLGATRVMVVVVVGKEDEAADRVGVGLARDACMGFTLAVY